MKKYCLFYLFLLINAIHLNAQTSLADLLGGVIKENNNQETSDTVSIIIDAVKPALSIIRQQYRLERNGEYYGKNNKPYYGESYSLGIKVPGGMILQRSVIAPWEYDAEYNRVNQGGKYSPSFFSSSQYSLSDKTWNPIELELETQYVTSLNKDSLLFTHADIISNFGISIEANQNNRDGYLIWVYSETNVQDDNLLVRLRQKKYELDNKTDSAYYSVSIKNPDKILGGIYVIPVIERAGYIKLLLSGIATKNKEGKWVLNILGRHSNSLNNDSRQLNNRRANYSEIGKETIKDEATLIK